MPLNALHHVTVKTADLEATRDFYRDILGLEVGFRPDLNFPVIGSIAGTSRSCTWSRKAAL
jgi:catechol 2,3-dioxygenase-like lactoylglutathione lyase family enzyme